MISNEFPLMKASMRCTRHSLLSFVRIGLGEESCAKIGNAPGDPGIGGNAAPSPRESGRGRHFHLAESGFHPTLSISRLDIRWGGGWGWSREVRENWRRTLGGIDK